MANSNEQSLPLVTRHWSTGLCFWESNSEFCITKFSQFLLSLLQHSESSFFASNPSAPESVNETEGENKIVKEDN